MLQYKMCRLTVTSHNMYEPTYKYMKSIYIISRPSIVLQPAEYYTEATTHLRGDCYEGYDCYELDRCWIIMVEIDFNFFNKTARLRTLF